jgi:hypothetical protein
MKAWKKLWSTDYVVTQSDVIGSSLPLTAMGVKLGNMIRVTVEEEVSECCEKWRGSSSLTAYKSNVVTEGGRCIQWLNHERVTGNLNFCPECGKKL